jgi:hypothetical protein
MLMQSQASLKDDSSQFEEQILTEFGNLLRNFRKRCTDPDDFGKRLSQERLGELLGREMGMQAGYSGAAVSDWERSKSKVHADQRSVLVSLIKILYRCGGIKTLEEANRFLETGNYRVLNRAELENTPFKETLNLQPERPESVSPGIQGVLLFLLGGIFSISDRELQGLISAEREGPTPYLPRVLVSLVRRSTDNLSASDLIRPVMWVWAWILTWWMITPSLKWPFEDQETARFAIILYIGGSFVAPILIGALSDTKHSKFWREHNLAEAAATRLYTYQGAGIGFHLGYFGIFLLNLLRYYIDLHFELWLELSTVAVMLLLGYAGARLVPYNLWRAYGRLDLNDGKVFFVFIAVGPFFGFFFFEYHEFLLGSIIGGLTILFTLTSLIIVMAWQQYRKTVKLGRTFSQRS